MKLMNYDTRTLIMQNVRSVSRETPTTYTVSQYRILFNLVKRKNITKEFFDFLLWELYQLKDWKKLSYSEMYELIYILANYNFNKEVDHEESVK